jgi:predicted metal-dependent HD superfamily phosphohydrolase
MAEAPSGALLARYAEPGRCYHTWEHIEACLAELERLDGLTPEERRTLTYAIWWHDAIYDPHRSDNETLSAELAMRDLAVRGAPDPIARETFRLIELTKGHEVEASDRLGAPLVSIDLSILGAAPELYDAHADAIRQEYAFVPEEAFRAGRAAILRRFLASSRIFPDPGFSERLETQARANLLSELERLASSPAG